MHTASDQHGFLRHVRTCNNATLPGGRVPFHVGADAVGWLSPDMVRALRDRPGIIVAAGPEAPPSGRLTLTTPETLPALARQLADDGRFALRNEEFDVRADPGAPVLARIDRGAIPAFGIQAIGVHVNGLVQRPDGLHVWVARRARNKQLDPGKLDHLVAGGVPAGLGPQETLIKEAAEEAAVAPELAGQAKLVAVIHYAMERPEGLRRDWLYCYDLLLPEGFTPRAADGEVESFELWPVAKVMEAVRTTDSFKFNVTLVLIDLFIRYQLIDGPEAVLLRSML